MHLTTDGNRLRKFDSHSLAASGQDQQMVEQCLGRSLHVKEVAFVPIGHDLTVAIFCDRVDPVTDGADGAPHEPEQDPVFVPM